MKKPVIGITPSHNTDNDDISVRPTYLRAIEAAGRPAALSSPRTGSASFSPWRYPEKT